MQKETPSKVWYLPAWQLVQLGTALEPPRLYFPAAQSVHAPEPDDDSVPAAHTEHEDAPESANFPAGQIVQLDETDVAE